MIKSISCPFCGEKIELDISVRPYRDDETNIKEAITNAINQFLIWNLFGKPKSDKQFLYDNYHKSVHFEIKDIETFTGTFRFSIQIEDSPEGDLWLIGSVQLKYGRIDWPTLSYYFNNVSI